MSIVETGYLPGPRGALHLTLFLPDAMSCPYTWVIHVPAFAEEMNKSRATVARQARALAGEGAAGVVPDLPGTGDSSAGLEDVSWQDWVEDTVYIARWAQAQGAERLVLWGHRLGCLLALDVAQVLGQSVAQLLLWQPVHSGKQHMTQFLRVRMAAGLAAGGSETVSSLQDTLLREQSLEVAGYALGAGLYQDIVSRTLSAFTPTPGTDVSILEVAADPGRPLMPVSQKLLEQWSQRGVSCAAQVVEGDPFWMTQELGFAPRLIEQTSALVMARLGVEESVGLPGSEEPTGSQTKRLADTSEQGEKGIVFCCGEQQLVGVVHGVQTESSVGVLIVVGGPQYRVGSHRQFVHLARHLAAGGVPAMRFDYRGMGDSAGNLAGFEHIGSDISSAIDAFQSECPGVSDIVLWGLCDAATASMFYAASDSRVGAVILANPWVYSPQGAAKAYLKHYYLQRLFQREFWSKVFSGKYSPSSSLGSARDMIARALGRQVPVAEPGEQSPVMSAAGGSTGPGDATTDLVARFAESLAAFEGRVLILLSSNDLTAAEFVDASSSNRALRNALKRDNVVQTQLKNMDHTFSRGEWRAEVEALSCALAQRLK